MRNICFRKSPGESSGDLERQRLRFGGSGETRCGSFFNNSIVWTSTSEAGCCMLVDKLDSTLFSLLL